MVARDCVGGVTNERIRLRRIAVLFLLGSIVLRDVRSFWIFVFVSSLRFLEQYLLQYYLSFRLLQGSFRTATAVRSRANDVVEDDNDRHGDRGCGDDGDNIPPQSVAASGVLRCQGRSFRSRRLLGNDGCLECGGCIRSLARRVVSASGSRRILPVPISRSGRD